MIRCDLRRVCVSSTLIYLVVCHDLVIGPPLHFCSFVVDLVSLIFVKK